MSAILDGRKVNNEIARELRAKIGAFSSCPTLAIIQIGEREESSAYIARKKDFGESIGAEVRHVKLQEDVPEQEIISVIQKLNQESSVHGIILQLPIPDVLNNQKLLDAVAPEKDVDGLGIGSRFTPATALGIAELLEYYHIPISGKKIAVLGRSALVGAPTARLLEKKGGIVTVCHSKTQNTREITKANDIIVVAIGKLRLIDASYFRADRTQTVVDVGITAVTEKGAERLEEEVPRKKLVGDVDFEKVKDMVAAISPVPGGVGPMTVAALFQNLTEAYELAQKQVVGS